MGLGAEGAGDGQWVLLVGGGVLLLQGVAALLEDFEAEVAASFGPFVGLFGEDGPDEADNGGAGGAPLSSSSRDGARRNSPGALIEFPHPGRVSL